MDAHSGRRFSLFIAVPTVRDDLQDPGKGAGELARDRGIGHQWWWEFRYPEYNITTANEIYIPDGPHGELHAPDARRHALVLDSAARRKARLIANHTNYIWFTPDSSTCGRSGVERLLYRILRRHRTRRCGSASFTVKPAQFAELGRADSSACRVRHIRRPRIPRARRRRMLRTGGQAPSHRHRGRGRPQPAAIQRPVDAPSAGCRRDGCSRRLRRSQTPAAALVTCSRGTSRVRLREAAHADSRRSRSTTRSRVIRRRGRASCSSAPALHRLPRDRGNPLADGQRRPEPHARRLAHRRSPAASTRTTPQHLALWIKNARNMKPGSHHADARQGRERSRRLKTQDRRAGLTDQQIADIVAYLQALK